MDTPSGCPGGKRCGEGGRRCEGRCGEVAEVASDRHRLLAGHAADLGRAHERLEDEVVGRPVGPGARRPERRERGDDHSRVDGTQVVGGDAEGTGVGRVVVVEDQVDAGDEDQEFVAAALRPEVDHDAALPTVEEPEPGGVLADWNRRPRGAPAAELVAGG